MRIERRRIDGDTIFVHRLPDGRAVCADRDMRSVLDNRVTIDPDLVRFATSPESRLVAPVEPSKIVCVGLNYRRHAEEMGKPLPTEPVIFIKPSTAVLDPGGTIELPPQSDEVHFEGELGVVIGRRTTRVTAADAAKHILGYTIVNDVTARDLQRRDARYTRAKGFDTFAPIGPSIAIDADPDALVIETRVNGQVRQHSGCDDMIMKVPELIAYVSAIMTLLPGDIISTGTPSGVGQLNDGDVVEVEIPGIGVLRNSVARRA
jgi:2-keto-4-pentenoate hydratase/2-oxohepta-3-ene-1,7-dioic acid hydratase in catechol pathway